MHSIMTQKTSLSLLKTSLSQKNIIINRAKKYELGLLLVIHCPLESISTTKKGTANIRNPLTFTTFF
jgi:hypothetical protein